MILFNLDESEQDLPDQYHPPRADPFVQLKHFLRCLAGNIKIMGLEANGRQVSINEQLLMV